MKSVEVTGTEITSFFKGAEKDEGGIEERLVRETLRELQFLQCIC